MKINRITYQHRRDFTAEFECEGCGHRQMSRGYDDANFHNNVIPNQFRCDQCGKTSKELGADYRPLTPKYPEGMQV